MTGRILLHILVAFSFVSSIAPVHAQFSDSMIKIGVLTDMAGVYSDITGKGSIVATQMAVDECLKAECAGLKIEVVSADHQNKADIGVARAREWIDTAGVDVLVDMSNASIQWAVPSIVKEKNRIALFAGGTARLTGDMCQPDHVMQWMWDTYVQVGAIANRLTKPDTKWFLVVADYAFGHQRSRFTYPRKCQGRQGHRIGATSIPRQRHVIVLAYSSVLRR
jgi:branched-chain amino acid transport system substrate-binding protein